MKPKIYLYGTSGQYGNYLAALTEAGAEPVLSRDLFRACGCDGLLLPGGGDIGVTLEATDSFLIRSFADSGRPILGICRGMQVISAALGGGLIQDLPPEQGIFHRGTRRDDARHPVRTRDGSLLAGLYGPILHTNSFHHQAVADPGFGMVITAWSEGGVAEAMEHERLPILGVQFHPERMAYTRRRPDCDGGEAIWEYFLKRCSEYN